MKRRTFIRALGFGASLPWLGPVALAVPDAPVSAKAGVHTILSCNIRVALPEDDAAGNGWKARRKLCLEVIRAQKPDLICCQEVLREQMDDLTRGLPEFASFGFEGSEMDARKEGYQGIAKNPIFYARERYELVSAGGFWLSETPHLPGSLSWESARARHVNWVRLRERASRRQFRVLSTHLDHRSQPAREEQIKMILAEAAHYAPDFPQLLAGDFNASAANTVLKLALEAGWTDSHTAAPGPRDDGNTTHGFLGPKYTPKTEAGRRKGPIDFILTRGPVSTLEWKIIRDGRDGRYPSDHYFLAAKVTFNP
ncbi:MAG TPA: endonuclease/exonuclease/phosphatase family protein [Verrucomicrobiota bacterium]|jgi:endonuclease/exonuclease/phosphatase family metal-dependent hydrolase|nr:endonuclease/exonuclease/phosphatase family protein [Verrucomicrobiota bacterium]HQL78838.1 endonuclease/exonuclease/phosphatase family protein [Verrucomicrobiota bacterium]